jgi:hypothetical protein
MFIVKKSDKPEHLHTFFRQTAFSFLVWLIGLLPDKHLYLQSLKIEILAMMKRAMRENHTQMHDYLWRVPCGN